MRSRTVRLKENAHSATGADADTSWPITRTGTPAESAATLSSRRESNLPPNPFLPFYRFSMKLLN